MHLKIQKRNGREYLSIVQSYREGGTVRSRTIETIGYADEFQGLYEDPIEHFRSYVDGLNQTIKSNSPTVDLAFDPQSQIEAQPAPPARLGAAIALGCLDALGVNRYFHARSGKDGFTAHAGRIFEMLATERMMHATSKRESWTVRASFPRECGFSFREVYEALPCFAHMSRSLDQGLLREWKSIAGEPNTDRVFLVCGSYAFPVDGGSVRASVAVALDAESMPLGYFDMQGRLEPHSFRQAVDELKDRLDAGRAVVVAGGLRDLDPTIAELAKTGDGFALYQRNFGEQPELAAWAQDEAGYEPLGGGVFMKERVTERALPDGSQLPVKEVALRGGGYATNYSHAVLVSSELDLSGIQIVQLYRELWRQAEPFQPLEADFSSMPFPTPAHDHIKAHFAICYAAFFALRLLRWKMGWKHNAAETADALLRMEGMHLQRNYYLFSYRSDATDRIESAVGIDEARRLRRKGELRSIPATVKRSFKS